MKELTSNLFLLSRDSKLIYTLVIFNAPQTEYDDNDLRLMQKERDFCFIMKICITYQRFH